MKSTSASALILVTILTILPTLCLAQYHPRPLPTTPTHPGSHRYDTPAPIVIPAPPPPGIVRESTVVDLNTGTVTIIQQTGNETFILRP